VTYVLTHGVHHLLLLLQGGYLRKYGRYGKPKQHWFRLSHDDRELLWDSSNVSSSRKAVAAAAAAAQQSTQQPLAGRRNSMQQQRKGRQQ
jgi:hypothetical protein